MNRRRLLHALALLAFVLAALDPAWGPASARSERWILLDVSASAVRGRAGFFADLPDLLSPALDSLRGENRVGILAFGKHPKPLLGPATARGVRRAGLPSLASVSEPPEGTATNLEAALREALRRAGPGADVALVSDGVETEGSIRRLVDACVARGVVVHQVTLGAAAGEDASLESLEVRARARAGERLRPRARARVEVSQPAWVRVRWLFAAGAETVERESALFVSASRTIEDVAEFETPSRGTYRVEARVSLPPGTDRMPENDAAGAGGRIEGESRVSVFRASSGGFAQTPGVGIEEIVVAGPIAPAVLERELPESDVLVLLGVPAASLVDVAPSLARALEGGGVGLLVAGTSEWAGYEGTPLEPLLPIHPRSPDDAGLDVLVLLDASGSMEGSKFDAARAGVARFAAAASLVDAVYGSAFAQSPGKVRTLRAPGRAVPEVEIEEFLAETRPRGKTDLYAAIREGADFLAALPRGGEGRLERGRRLFLLSDGKHESGPADVEGAVQALRRADARVEFFAIGEDADMEALEAVARAAGGGVRRVEDPALVGEALRRAGEGERVRREREAPRRSGGRRAEPFPLEVPATFARARCTAKEGSEVFYEFEGGEPLLATWNVGLGSTAAFLSTPGSADAPGWAAEGELWRRLFDLLAAPRGNSTARLEGDRLVVETREEPGPLPNLRASVGGVEVSLDRRGVRRFEGPLAAEAALPSAVAVRIGEGPWTPVGVVGRPFPAEFAGGAGANAAATVVAATGGVSVEAGNGVSLPPPPRGAARAGVRPWAATIGGLVVAFLSALRRSGFKGSRGRADAGSAGGASPPS